MNKKFYSVIVSVALAVATMGCYSQNRVSYTEPPKYNVTHIDVEHFDFSRDDIDGFYKHFSDENEFYVGACIIAQPVKFREFNKHVENVRVFGKTFWKIVATIPFSGLGEGKKCTLPSENGMVVYYRYPIDPDTEEGQATIRGLQYELMKALNARKDLGFAFIAYGFSTKFVSDTDVLYAPEVSVKVRVMHYIGALKFTDWGRCVFKKKCKEYNRIIRRQGYRA